MIDQMQQPIQQQLPPDLPRPSTVQNTSDIIDLRDLFRAWRKGWWLIVLAVVVGCIVGVRDILAFAPVYEARVVITPATQNFEMTPMQGAGSLVRAFGLTTAEQGDTPFQRLIYVISSVNFANILQEKHGLLQQVYADSWNEQTKTWRRPQGWQFDLRQRLYEFTHGALWQEPNTESLAAYLKGIKLNKLKDSNFYEFVFSHPDPDFALYILNLAFREADSYVRQQDQIQVETRRKYLESQLARSSALDMRTAVLSLLTTEERRAMLLQDTGAYAVRVIEPPHVSSRPVPASVPRIIGVPVLGLLVLAFGVLTMWGIVRRE